MKSYKLLKDLPDALSGATFNYDPLKNAYVCSGCGVHREYSKNTVEQTPDWFQKITEKPPIGIPPLWIHNEKRLMEINNAIRRYELVEKTYPLEWLAEKQTLEEWLEVKDTPKRIDGCLNAFSDCSCGGKKNLLDNDNIIALALHSLKQVDTTTISNQSSWKVMLNELQAFLIRERQKHI